MMVASNSQIGGATHFSDRISSSSEIKKCVASGAEKSIGELLHNNNASCKCKKTFGNYDSLL
jgi:hypothetical protein